MDIAIVWLLAQVQQQLPTPLGNGDMVGQAYLVLNTTALIGAAFWLGVQWNTIRTSQREIGDLKKKIDLPVAPLAEMQATIDNIKEDVERLTDSMDRFQRSIFMESIRLGRERREDDAKTRE